MGTKLFEFKVDRLQIIVVAKYITVLQLFISRMPKMCAIFHTDNKGKWKRVFDYYLKKHGGRLLFQGNLKKQDIPVLVKKEPFLRETAEQWTNINFTEKNPDFICARG